MKLQAMVAGLALAAIAVATWRYHQIRLERAEGRGVLAGALAAGQRVALEGTQVVERPGQPPAAGPRTRNPRVTRSAGPALPGRL